MFEKIVLRRAENGTPISAGQIAEALLFYQNVHLVIDRPSLGHLVRQVGIGTLISILSRDDCTAIYCEEMLGTHSQGIQSWRSHNYVALSVVGHEGIGQFHTTEERVAFLLRQSGVPDKQATRFAKLFLKRAPRKKLSGDSFMQGGVIPAARRDLFDPNLLLPSVNAALDATPGAHSLGDLLKFEVTDSNLGIYVLDNIDYQAINSRRAKLLPALEPITVAHLLSNILDARADLAIAAFYDGDFATSASTSAIIEVRVRELLHRSRLNRGELSDFQRIVLNDYPSIRETIDSGQRTFKEFLVLLDKSARFKRWLKTARADAGLVRSYMTDISKEGWIRSVPGRSMRYVMTATAEAQNPLIGIAAAIADNFLIEKLLGGWRPNHFVDERLSPFLDRHLT